MAVCQSNAELAGDPAYTECLKAGPGLGSGEVVSAL